MRRSFYLWYFSLIVISISLIMISGCGKNQDESKVQVTTASNSARGAFLAGRDLSEKLRGQESLEYFETAIKDDDKFALAYYYHALANPTAKGFFSDLNKAVRNASKASDGERLMIMALQANANGDQKMQEDYLTDLVKQYPNDERVQNLAGQFYYAQQNFDKAIEYLNNSVKVAPDYAPSYNMLGYSYMNKDNFTDADAAFKKYIKLIPDEPNPYDSYGELLLKQGANEESIQQYRKALDIDPNFITAYIGIASNNNKLGKYDEARKELETALSKSRNDADKRNVLYAMAVSYYDQGNYDMAKQQITERYRIAKDIDDYANMSADLINLGNIFYEQGNYADALKKYDEALQVTLKSDLSNEQKENAKALSLYNSARIKLAQDDLAEGRKLTQEFTTKVTKTNNINMIWLSHELEGLIALKEKDYRRADSEFQKTNQQDPYTQYYLGLADEGLKDNQSASKHFETALKFNAANSLNQSFIKQKRAKKATV